MHRLFSILSACAILALASSAATAQTTYRTIVPKSLGEPHSFKPQDLVMTREELRACMKLNESNNVRYAELVAKIEQHEKERFALDEAKHSATPPPDANKQLEVEWKKRNAVLLKEEEKLDDSREDYFVDCARKRFLEEDEIAIKSGK
jgi:hypothetical protein